MHSSLALIAFMAAGSAVAKIIEIDVGKGGLVYSPDTVTADVGDTLEFHFFASFHTAVQGDFSTPCQRGSLESTGFNSGPINNKADGTPNVFQVTVKDTNPIWFYCSTTAHCQSGMVGVVNPPSSGPNTLAAYKSSAAGTTTSEGSASVDGGVVVPVGTSPSGSSSAPVSSSTPASSASSRSSSSSSSVSSATTGATGATTAASGGVSSTGSAAAGGSTTSSAAGSTSTSAKPSTATTSGANGPQASIFAAQGTLAALAVGLGLLVFLMV